MNINDPIQSLLLRLDICQRKIVMRIGYFTNKYPAVSHTFIRREILAIESLGVIVFRYALRAGEHLVDKDDKCEEKRTRYILKAGAGEIVRCFMAALLTRPLALGKAIRQAIKMGVHSDRGILRHLAYVVEAAVLAHWCRRDGIQHIHAHFGTNAAAIAMFAWQLSGVSYSFTAHGPEEFEKASLLSLDVKLENAAFAVCVSSFGRSQFMRWSRSDQWPKIAVVHCGLDSAFFEGFPSPPPTPRLVCVGRISVEKAQILLVAAVRRLRDAGIACKIVLAGDGPMRPEVEDAIRRAGLQDAITVTGWISSQQVKAEIETARALVLPSFAENMPVAIMESLARGRPVISTYVAGIPELIQPGRTGWLVPAGDDMALADAMQEALETPIERLSTMGDAGRLQMVEHHDALKEAAKLKSLFEEQLSRRAGQYTRSTHQCRLD
jgi:colanic acid/amylovoran biosynthesis glycosyltransferase